MGVTNTAVLSEICSASNRAAFVALLDRLGDKWTILIVAERSQGPLRYNELQRRIGLISQRMLTFSLKALVANGLVTRTSYAAIPPHVEYELTPLGITLRAALQPLWDWAQSNMDDPGGRDPASSGA